MAIEIRVPELGESVLGATVHQWLKHEGEPVRVGEALVELETDKVNLEVGAKESGILAHITIPEGEDVEIGALLGTIEPEVEGKPAGSSSPITSEAPDETEETVESERTQALESSDQPKTLAESGEERTTPVARRLAREQGVDLGEIPGSGPGGRVMKRDVQEFLSEHPGGDHGKGEGTIPEPGPAMPEPANREKAGAPKFSGVETPGRSVERIRMTRRRRTIAHRLVAAQNSAAILTTFNEIDMSAVMELRHKRNEAFQARYGVKLGITSFFVKAAIGALKDYQQINAEIDGDEMIIKHYFDIGIAIGDQEGLVVPVLRNADRMSFVDIERKINEFSQKAAASQLSLDDLMGGTFTITNGGVFGSMLSTPILNPPQVAILGLHKIERRPVIINEEIAIRSMMYVALSYDHRIVDGREAVRFLARVKEFIEDPEKLLLEG